jgi:signal transduction histidine kinase
MIAATAPASRPLSSPPPTLLQLLRRVPLAYTDSRSWRALAHVLTGGPVAIVAAALVCLGAASGVLSLVVVGLPLFCCTLVGCRLLAWLERGRALVVDVNPIGARYHPTDGLPVLGKVRVLITDPATWRDVLWSALIAPLGLASLAVTLVGAMLSVVLLAAPLWFRVTSAHRAVVLAVVVVLGLFGCCVGPWIIRGLSSLQLATARVLVGPDSWTSLVSRVSQLTVSRAAAADAQRGQLRRIERDLHDGAQARLVALAVDLGIALEKLGTEPEEGRRLVEQAHEQSKLALADLRQLVRGIAPAVLEDRGLDAALSAIVANSAVPVTLDVDVPHRLPEAVETAAYFVVSEALANVAKHSGAATCRVRVREHGGIATVEVSDEGRGGADALGGSGLRGLGGRVAALDGWFQVSSPAGGPTVVRAEIPCAS